jgi:hypothetical protein
MDAQENDCGRGASDDVLMFKRAGVTARRSDQVASP